MLNHNLNQIFVLLCIATITGAPFFFRYWVKTLPFPELSRVDKMTSFLTTVIFGALFVGAFVFSSASRATGEVLLAASILSFAFLYQSRWTALQAGNRTEEPSPKRSLRSSAAKFLLVLVALGFLSACREAPILLALILFTPFLMPLFLKLQYASQKMAESSFKSDILAVFNDSGVQIQDIYLIDSEHSAQANALVAGSRFGRGIFGRTLFVTLSLVETLSEEELHAVLLHEAAHFKLNHIPKRLLYSSLFFVLSIFWIAMPTAFLFQKEPAAIVAACFCSLLAQFYLLGRMVYRQELEADLTAVHSGASSEALVSALKKLCGQAYAQKTHFLTRLVFGVFHPTGEEREKTLYFGNISHDLDVVPHKPYCFAYSLFVVGLIFWSAQNQGINDGRTPANAPSDSAKISRSENG